MKLLSTLLKQKCYKCVNMLTNNTLSPPASWCSILCCGCLHFYEIINKDSYIHMKQSE